MSKSTDRVREWRAAIKNKADWFDEVENARLARLERAKPEIINRGPIGDAIFLKDYILFAKREYAKNPDAFRFPERFILAGEDYLVLDWGNTPPNYAEYAAVERGVRRTGHPQFKMPKVKIEHVAYGLGPMPAWKLRHLFMGTPDGGVIHSFEQDDEIDAEERGAWEAAQLGTPNQE